MNSPGWSRRSLKKEVPPALAEHGLHATRIERRERLRECREELAEVDQARRPHAEHRRRTEVAVHAAVEKRRAPGLREGLRTLKADAVIVAPRDHRAGVGQALQDHAAETLQRTDGARRHRPVAISGRHKKHAGHFLHRLGLFEGPLHHQRGARAVRHQHHRLRRPQYVIRQRRGPRVIDRMIPVRLLHPNEIGEGLFPVGVPVVRARAVEAGVDQDGEVFEGGHGVGIRWILVEKTLSSSR